MRKLSKKAKRLIIDYSSAAADLTNKAIRPNFIQFGEARAALMDYIAELEGFINQLIEAGDAMSNAQSMWVAEENKWDAIVAEYKERER